MAKLGSDFRASVPDDGAYVRHPVLPQLFTELRDIRSRIKAFFSEVFDADTGQLQLSSVPAAALKTPSNDPSGTWRRVTVSRKGLVTSGSDKDIVVSPRIYRGLFFGDGLKLSTIDTDTGSDILTPTADAYPLGTFDGDGFWSGSIFGFQKFTFAVPEGVYRVRATLIGCGKNFGSSATAARQKDVVFSTTPGSVLCIWAGNSDGSVSRISNVDQSKYIDSSPAQSPDPFDAVDVGWYGSSLRGYGVDGTASAITGTPGVVILEWYA